MNSLTEFLLPWFIVASVLCAPIVVDANDIESVSSFETCRAQLRDKALTENLSPLITKQVIDALAPLERVIKQDRNQAEFSESFDGYVGRRVTQYRIDKGQALLIKHANLLNKLEKQYEVPARYLVAFWGLETNFGSHKGKTSTLNALATLACDKRRGRYFTKELLQLFRLIDNKQLDPEELVGSWAGAMGHMQFMPSTLAQYGVDGDGDQRINIWESLPDALSSAANYLSQIGWRKQALWGRVVELPKGFAFEEIIVGQPYPLSKFKQLGVMKRYGRPLPAYDTQARLLMPSGHKGPIFLAYDNLRVIMKWNFSESYALAVGLLADSLVDISHGLKADASKRYGFTKPQLKQLQAKLNALGLDAGKPDGILGSKTRRAIQQFQIQQQLIADGFPNADVFSSLASQF